MNNDIIGYIDLVDIIVLHTKKQLIIYVNGNEIKSLDL